MESAGDAPCVARFAHAVLETLTIDAPVSDARKAFSLSGASHLLVLDGGALVGIVCPADLAAAPDHADVGACMASPVLCISHDTALQDALDIMAENDISYLPVVEGGDIIIGFVSQQSLEHAAVSSALQERPPVPASEPCEGCGSVTDVCADPGAANVSLCASCRGRLVRVA